MTITLIIILISSVLISVEAKSLSKNMNRITHATNQYPLICGDCNGDGRVTVLDSLYASQHEQGLRKLASPNYESCNVMGISGGIADPGATVDSLDAQEISNYAVGLVSHLNCEKAYKIVFASYEGGIQSDIYVMNSDGSGKKRLTKDPGEDYIASFSPDGSMITFVSSRTGNNEVYRIDASGNDLTRLTYNPGRKASPTFSTDGRHIYFTTTDVIPGRSDIMRMSLKGSIIDDITHGLVAAEEPHQIPGTNKLVFVTDLLVPREKLYTIDLTTLQVDPLTVQYPGRHMAPRASPDGTKIAFISNGSGTWELYTIDSNGNNLFQVTSNGAEGWTPTWSPDGKKLMFTGRNAGTEIYRINKDGTNLIQLTKSGGSSHGQDAAML